MLNEPIATRMASALTTVTTPSDCPPVREQIVCDQRGNATPSQHAIDPS